MVISKYRLPNGLIYIKQTWNEKHWWSTSRNDNYWTVNCCVYAVCCVFGITFVEKLCKWYNRLCSTLPKWSLKMFRFSNTFQKIQDNSVLIWKFHRYSLVREYYERPVLPPPLIIFNHIYRTILFVKQKLNKDSNKPDNVFERTISGIISE